MASPNILGINAGAELCMILLLTVFEQAVGLSPLLCFAGAMLAAMIILAIGRHLPQAKNGIILAGIVITTLFNAGISFLSLFDTDTLAAYRMFSVGGLEGITDGTVLLIPAGMIAAGLVICLLFADRLGALSLGDTTAAGLDIRPNRLRTICLSAAAACAAVVSFAGLLGFVGLLVPHIARRLAGHRLRDFMPVCVLLGTWTVTFADLVGRLVFAPTQVPVGVLMAFFAAPVYFRILKGNKS